MRCSVHLRQTCRARTERPHFFEPTRARAGPPLFRSMPQQAHSRGCAAHATDQAHAKDAPILRPASSLGRGRVRLADQGASDACATSSVRNFAVARSSASKRWSDRWRIQVPNPLALASRQSTVTTSRHRRLQTGHRRTRQSCAWSRGVRPMPRPRPPSAQRSRDAPPTAACRWSPRSAADPSPSRP